MNECVSTKQFSQMTGINAILYFTPQLFASLGGGLNIALISAVIVNGTLVVAAITSVFLIEKLGRRPLLIGGGAFMAVSQIAVGIVLALEFDPTGAVALDESIVYIVLVLICLFTFTFGMTWGPLGTYCIAE